MTEEELKSNKIEVVSSGIQPVPETQQPLDFEGYIPFLEAIRKFRQHLDAVPTNVPKSLLEQIQLFDDGSSRGIYAYINKVWRLISSGATRSKASAYASSSTSFAGSEVKIVFQTEGFDSLNEFDAVTNYRFVPQVEDDYLITAQVALSVSEVLGVVIKKSGATNIATAKGTTSALASRLVHLTTSDYIEIYAFKPDAVNRACATGVDMT